MDRPYTICHMCTTIDGKILSSRWGRLPGKGSSAELFETTAASFGIGAWVVGTTTMKEFAGRNLPLKGTGTSVPPGDFMANTKTKKFAIGTDANGVLRFQQNEVDGDHVVLLITRETSNAYRAHLRVAGASYLLCGAEKIDLPLAMKKLHDAFGLRKLMVQGGGAFNGSMLRAGLIDEISQVIVPVVDGGGPSITGFFDAPGKPPTAAAAKLRVIRHDAMPGGVHWFRYRVIPKK